MERNNPFTALSFYSSIVSAAQRPGQRMSPSFRCRQIVPLLLFILVPGFLSMLASCSSAVAPPKRTVPITKKIPTASAARQQLPDGWADITSRSHRPQIVQWIVHREYTATMVLKELHADPETMREVLKEGMNCAAEISMRGKIPPDDSDIRVTRVPAMADGPRSISTYVYSERGLLRRVAVFEKKGRLMELELMQEQSGASFESLSEAHLQFARMIQDR